MSLFGSIGKLLGGVVKAGLGVATGGVSNTVLGVAGSLFHHKSPMSGGKVTTLMVTPGSRQGMSTAAVLRHTPTLPGGSTAPGVSAPRLITKARKRRASVRAAPRRTGTKRRKSRLKFGSPAWRAKFMRKKKRRR